MVAGHLQEKNNLYYVVLNYADTQGKRKSKWISTGLPVKGNKKRAEARLMKEREKFVPAPKISQSDILFADYMEQWLDIIKPSIEVVTFASYSTMVKSAIAPYFRKKKITLSNLKPKDIQDFYTQELKRVKASSVIHYHANIHKALKYAVKMGLISTNPADQVDRPRKEKFVGSFYDSEEVQKLFEIAKGTKLELAVLFGAFYGLRRSEIVGLKWDAIDFKENAIVIRHTVTSCTLDGQKLTISKDRTKNVSSLRSLPLVPVFREKLLALKTASGKPQAVPQVLLHGIPGLHLRGRVGRAHQAELHCRGVPQAAGAARPAGDPLPRPAAQLREPLTGGRGSDESHSGMAGAQHLFHHGGHLLAPFL